MRGLIVRALTCVALTLTVVASGPTCMPQGAATCHGESRAGPSAGNPDQDREPARHAERPPRHRLLPHRHALRTKHQYRRRGRRSCRLANAAARGSASRFATRKTAIGRKARAFLDIDEIPKLSRAMASMAELAQKWTGQDDRQPRSCSLQAREVSASPFASPPAFPGRFSTGLIDPVVTSIEVAELGTLK